MIDGEGALLHQSVGAWLRVIGRLRPGASTAGMAPRLTGVLRQWMQYDSGYPANWMPDVIRMLPKQVINVVPAGAGVAEMKEEYGRSLQILLGGLRPGAVDRLRQCRQPAAGARRWRAADKPPCAWRWAPARRQIVGQALVESDSAGGRRWNCRAGSGEWRRRVCCWRWLSIARTSCPSAPLPSPIVLGLRSRLALLTGIDFWRGPRLVRHSHRSGRKPCAAPAAARAIILPSPARRCWSCRRHSRSCWSPAPPCWRAASNKLEHQDFGYRTEGRVVVVAA